MKNTAHAKRHELLACSSMSHAIDRATAFTFHNPPYCVVAVAPNAITLDRAGVTLFVYVHSIEVMS